MFRKGSGPKLADDLLQKINANKQNMTSVERRVYDRIVQGGSSGAWIRELRDTTDLHSSELTRVLNALSRRGFIRSYKSAESSRRVFVISEIQPGRMVSGGMWYAGGDFDASTVQALQHHVFELCQSGSGARPEEILASVRERGLTRHEVEASDVEIILGVLLSDGFITKMVVREGPNEVVRYHSVNTAGISDDAEAFSATPCMGCPVRASCGLVGAGPWRSISRAPVTTATCKYWKDWFNDADAAEV